MTKTDKQGTESRKPLMSIGEVVARYGVTHRALRFYEQKGLLKPVRTKTQRYYQLKDCKRIAMIKQGQAIGFTLNEIKTYLRLYDINPSKPDQLASKKSDLLSIASDLKHRRKAISKALSEISQTVAWIDSLGVSASESQD